MQFGNRFCGIEHSSIDDDARIYALILKKTKNEILAEDSLESGSIDELALKLPKDQHAFLVINDRQILTKTIDSNQEETLQIVSKAFPNLVLKEFYYEVISQNKKHFVAIGRRSHIDDIVKRYMDSGIRITGLSLGCLMVSGLSSFLESGDITTSNANIVLEDGSISSIQNSDSPQQKTYDVNGLMVDSSHLLSLSGALDMVLQTHGSKTNLETKNRSLLDEYKQVHFFGQFLKFGLVFILGLLLVNFFFFNHYFKKLGALQETAQVNQASKSKALELDASVAKVEKMFKDMMSSNSSKTSFYANTIMQDLPSSIVLDELNYQPLLRRVKADQPISINNNSLILSGISSNSDSYSNWLSLLEDYDWTTQIVTLHYGSESTRTSDFSIKITISDDQ